MFRIPSKTDYSVWCDKGSPPSLPKDPVERLEEQKRRLEKCEAALHRVNENAQILLGKKALP